jgi:hypothetical protein
MSGLWDMMKKIPDVLRQSQVIWKKHKGVGQNIIHFPVSLPKLSFSEIVRAFIGTLFPQMLIVITEEGG